MLRATRRCSSSTAARRALSLAVLTLAFSVVACNQQVEEVPEVYRPTNEHDAYRHGLVQSGLGTTALSRDWIAASETALREPVTISAPFRESGYFDEAAAAAVGYRFDVTAGQRIDAQVDIAGRGAMRIFMDLFRLVDDDPQAPIHVASGATLIEPPGEGAGTPIAEPENVRRLRLEPLRDGTYVLRIQPELLRSARYTVQVMVDASLAFPVAGRTMQDAWSAFGAEREGGRRSHRGVDIFAPRGTPVLAASDGVVSRANTTPVGGNVVWVNDANRNVRLYYAHLDSHSVESGQRVKVGDQLGTVGNTGNAITTPPHLHFGVYARGAVNPDPFLRSVNTDPEEIVGTPEQLGGWLRSAGESTDIYDAPARSANRIGALARNTPFRVWGATADWYRVSLPDGSAGYVTVDATEPATPLRSEALGRPTAILDHPGELGAVIDELAPGAELPVLGAFGSFLYVQTPAGRTGWLPFD